MHAEIDQYPYYPVVPKMVSGAGGDPHGDDGAIYNNYHCVCLPECPIYTWRYRYTHCYCADVLPSLLVQRSDGGGFITGKKVTYFEKGGGIGLPPFGAFTFYFCAYGADIIF